VYEKYHSLLFHFIHDQLFYYRLHELQHYVEIFIKLSGDFLDLLSRNKNKTSSPVTGLEWPRGFQEVKVPIFHDNGTGWRLGCQPYALAAFTPRKYTWYSFLLKAESTQGHTATGRIMSLKNSNDTTGNRNRDLLVCSVVPKPLRHRVPHFREIPG
jgi:hypothetical protein